MENILSAEEFNRMQTQLLGLREVNYQLEDQCRSQQKEIVNLQGHVAALNADLQKANKGFKTGNRKVSPADAVVRENESLKHMLMRQDNEFRLQNETLLSELAQVMAVKQEVDARLEAEHKAYEHSATLIAHLHDEMRHLQAENCALQKAVAAAGGKAASEPFTILDNNSASAVVDSPEVQHGVDLHLQLQTEKEENQMLSQQMHELEEFNKQEVSSLLTEVARLSEKLRKKQDSFLQFQQEQEILVNELAEKLRRYEENDDSEILRQNYYKLSDDLAACRKLSADTEAWLKSRCAELEETVVGLQRQAETLKTEHALNLSAFELSCQQSELRAGALMAELDDLRAQLKEYQSAQTTSADQLMLAETRCSEYLAALRDMEQLATERKYLLEELVTKTNIGDDQLKEAMAQYRNQLQLAAATENQLATKSAELESAERELSELRPRARDLEHSKKLLEQQLSETQESLKTTKELWDTSLEVCKHECEEKIAQMEMQHHSELEEFQQNYNLKLKDIEDLKATIVRIEQDVKDEAENRKIHESKGVAMMKDLKKQVQSERHRADNLQERLQRFLADAPHGRQAAEELFQPPDVNKRHRTGEDGSSVSSWSLVGAGGTGGGGGSRDGSCLSQTPDEDGWTVLRQENDELLRRMTELQQKAWMLEEKVLHLESSNSSMADDLLNKTAIIEHYLMDAKPDQSSAAAASSMMSSSAQEKNTLRRMFDFMKDGNNDENLKDINRKLQKLLEETLIRNMQLQKDMEKVADEKAREL